MKNIFCSLVLIFCSSTSFAMKNVEEFTIKVVNETVNGYYLKIPEELIAEKDWEQASDEFQRWRIEPEDTEYVFLQMPEDAKCSALIEIKSRSRKDQIKKDRARYSKKDDERKDEPPSPAFGRIVIYKDPSVGRSIIHLHSKFEPNLRYETKKPIKEIMLLINQKESGVSLLRLYKEQLDPDDLLEIAPLSIFPYSSL